MSGFPTDIASPPAPPLTLKAALLAVNAAGADRLETFRLGIACGFTPLHLDVLLRAYVEQALASVRATAAVGTYGDLAVALSDLAGQDVDGQVVFVEWADIDPRLSPRRAGSAAQADPTELLASARTRLARLANKISDVAARRPVVVVPPTVPLPLYFSGRAGQVSAGHAGLDAAVAEFVVAISTNRQVRVLNPTYATQSREGAATDSGYDLRMDLKADFPYTVDHASRLARDSVALLLHAPPKKGLITDLDDTLWRGLVGEIGAEAVSWSLHGGSQVHAMYQALLARLTAQGVLVGVVSKNEKAVVEAALSRPDLIVPVDKVFPVLASWAPKSRAVSDVLRSWNIGASDVVMVDDSALELAEISDAHPDISTAQFEPNNPAAVLALLAHLEDLFARDTHSAEDDLRVASLRSAVEFERARDDQGDYQAFLADVGATVRIELDVAHENDRAYELAQKTNQFNLNGRRQTSLEWKTAAERRGAISLVGYYADRFGALGNVSVLTGVLDGTTVTVDCWVLSCRAFSRAVEHHMLRALVDAFHADTVVFDYVETARNNPTRAFLQAMGAHENGAGVSRLTATAIRDHLLSDVHAVTLVQRDAITSSQGD